MKKILTLVLVFLIVTSCQNELTELNTNPKRALIVPGETLFSSAEKSLTDAVASGNVNTNIFRLLSQQWAQTTYTDESRYDLVTRNIPQTFWNIMYRDVLRDLLEAKNLIGKQDPLYNDPIIIKNKLAVIEILSVYTYSILVNTFGNIPYSQALDINTANPKYDDAATITNDLFTRLNAALASLEVATESFGDADLVYGGDVVKWMKFGHSLKLKMAMILADADPAKAKTFVEQAAPHVFTSNADNAVFKYLPAPPNTNPIWVDLVQSGRQDFVAANTLIDKMNTLIDPRRAFYFTPLKDDTFKGGTYGASNSYPSFSKPGEMIVAPTFEALLLDYSEIEFYLAEALERGFSLGAVPGTAETHYTNGITASLSYWGVSQEDIDKYVAMEAVAYATASGNYKEKIGTQKWIALYNRGYDAWTEWRRLDYPTLKVPSNAVLPSIPVRYTYPVLEQNLNTTNYNEAAATIGGDKAATKLFWDKF
ncbi:MAG: SusD/RagB family nutrient-binding outer membrane lipoprotein [Bacteroidota bacterium]